ncbi:MAG: tripartite tricarboxylate transporter substrate binding protein [Proteobacteria bacterium]|nr:tripartite tricarboxylate transporter substrate binding protein [Pseudomonadota bacterium]
MKSALRSLCLALFAATTAAGAQPQAAYPDRPVKLVVGFPAGQATDLVARVLAEKLAKSMGQPFIVENKPGQGASLGVGSVAKSAPDGYTMALTAAAAMVTNPHLYKNVGYDPLRDFAPCAMLLELPLALVAHPSAPFNTVPELIAYAKAHPDKLSYASSGNGTMSHLAMERLKRQSGLALVHVPYQGSVRSMTDLVAGNVALAFDTLAVTVPQIEARKLKPIAVATTQRVPSMPNVPTIAESGVADFTASPWLGVVFPAGTPKAIVNRMHAELMKAMDDPAVQKSMQILGAQPRLAGPQEFEQVLRADHAKWGRIVAESGARVD